MHPTTRRHVMTIKRPDTENEDVFDERGVMRDKKTFVVPMQFRDERTVINDAVRSYMDARKELLADGGSRGAHSAGWAEDKSRGFAVGMRNDALAQIYQEVEQSSCSCSKLKSQAARRSPQAAHARRPASTCA